ncbi:MAG TPA: ParB-like protein, partial [Bradyrhizobium sp.]
PYAAIPTSIADLTDNIWRTLGRRLRGKAFEDLDTPYQEFMWGDYFRTFMTRRLIELEFDLAAEVAAKLSRLPEAQDLPGYWG